MESAGNGFFELRPDAGTVTYFSVAVTSNDIVDMPALFRVEATLMQARMPALQSFLRSSRVI